MSPTRLLELDDVPAIHKLVVANRDFLAPWEPLRTEDYYTLEGQDVVVRTSLDLHAQGINLPHVILDDDGRIAGRITLNGIVRGPLLSCSVGYWVSKDAIGRGLATMALGELKRIAFEEQGLHRIQAETLLHNGASQRVLARHGFEQFGMAPSFLKINGTWQDNLMFQVLSPHPV